MISHDVIVLWHSIPLLFLPFFLSNFHSLKTNKYLCKLFSVVMISSFFVYTLTLSFPYSGETPENKSDIFQGKHLILLVCSASNKPLINIGKMGNLRHFSKVEDFV